MKRVVLTLGALALLTLGSSAQSTQPDSTKSDRKIQIVPYQAEISPNATGTFGFTMKDSIAFQTYAGQSVFNTLRGHIPNVSFSADFYSTPGTLRADGTQLIIDGFAYGSGITSYYNLNSFEFQNIYAFSGAAATMYGGAASNGAVFVESKNGKNYRRPTFEFNSSPSYTWYNDGAEERVEQWRLQNTIAYQQDFGKVDARVSYNFGLVPDNNYGPENKVSNHNFKLNTGIEITPRFDARLIVDKNYGINKMNYFYYAPNMTQVEYQSETEDNMLQGNLMLRYRVLNWLSISSQHTLSQIDRDFNSTNPSLGSSTSGHERLLSNIFVSVNTPLVGKLSFNAFVGGQYESQTGTRMQESLYGFLSEVQEYKTESLLQGLGLQLGNYLFANYNYRSDKFSILTSGDDSEPTYSLSTAFVFSEAFRLNNSWFTQGKLRANYGESSYISNLGYPFTWSSTASQYPAERIPMERITFETGIDLSFFNDRLLLQMNYFNDVNLRNFTMMPLPWYVGYGYQLVNIGEIRTKGWEVVLGTTAIRRENMTLNTKFIYGTYESKIESGLYSSSSSSSQVIAYDPSPDWRGSVLNQVVWKNFFLSFLIDMRKGGDYISGYNLGAGDFSLSVQDGTLTKLRDVSVGYSLLRTKAVREIRLSLSGRNIWTIYSKSNMDIDGPATHQRGIALGATCTF